MSLIPKTPIPEGAIRFNTDSSKMEVWIGDKWMQVAVSSPNLDGGGRGLLAGGNVPGQTNIIQFVTISSTGNSQDFGDLTALTQAVPAATGSSTRGIIAGGQIFPATTNKIDFVTIASTGDASDFGDLTQAQQQAAGTGSQTRGIFAGGEQPSLSNKIDLITIASTGDAVDFGDLSVSRRLASAASSPTRSLIIGGYDGSNDLNVIDFVTTSH